MAKKESNREHNYPYIHEKIDGVWHRKRKKARKKEWERLIITHEDVDVCIGNGKDRKYWEHRTRAVWTWVPLSKLEE